MARSRRIADPTRHGAVPRRPHRRRACRPARRSRVPRGEHLGAGTRWVRSGPSVPWPDPWAPSVETQERGAGWTVARELFAAGAFASRSVVSVGARPASAGPPRARGDSASGAASRRPRRGRQGIGGVRLSRPERVSVGGAARQATVAASRISRVRLSVPDTRGAGRSERRSAAQRPAPRSTRRYSRSSRPSSGSWKSSASATHPSRS